MCVPPKRGKGGPRDCRSSFRLVVAVGAEMPPFFLKRWKNTARVSKPTACRPLEEVRRLVSSSSREACLLTLVCSR